MQYILAGRAARCLLSPWAAPRCLLRLPGTGIRSAFGSLHGSRHKFASSGAGLIGRLLGLCRGGVSGHTETHRAQWPLPTNRPVRASPGYASPVSGPCWPPVAWCLPFFALPLASYTAPITGLLVSALASLAVCSACVGVGFPRTRKLLELSGPSPQTGPRVLRPGMLLLRWARAASRRQGVCQRITNTEAAHRRPSSGWVPVPPSRSLSQPFPRLPRGTLSGFLRPQWDATCECSLLGSFAS